MGRKRAPFVGRQMSIFWKPCHLPKCGVSVPGTCYLARQEGRDSSNSPSGHGRGRYHSVHAYETKTSRLLPTVIFLALADLLVEGWKRRRAMIGSGLVGEFWSLERLLKPDVGRKREILPSRICEGGVGRNSK